MAKTYTAAGSATAGDVYTASAHNVIVTDVNNLIVPAYCEIARVATQTINDATDTDISFDTEVHDTDGMFAPTSTTITVNTTGIYVITAEIGLNTTVDIRGDIILYIGGVVKAREVQYGTSERFGMSHIEAITAGTTMKVTTYLDNTANTSRNLTARFRAAWIGRTS